MKIKYWLDSGNPNSIVAEFNGIQVWAVRCNHGKAVQEGQSEESGLIEINGAWYGTGMMDADPLDDDYYEIVSPPVAFDHGLLIALGAAIGNVLNHSLD